MQYSCWSKAALDLLQRQSSNTYSAAAIHTIIACFHVVRDKKKKKGDADAESGGESPGSPGDDADATPEEVVWMTDTSEQAAQQRAEKQLTKAMADMVTQASVVLHCEEVSACTWIWRS